MFSVTPLHIVARRCCVMQLWRVAWVAIHLDLFPAAAEGESGC